MKTMIVQVTNWTELTDFIITDYDLFPWMVQNEYDTFISIPGLLLEVEDGDEFAVAFHKAIIKKGISLTKTKWLYIEP